MSSTRIKGELGLLATRGVAAVEPYELRVPGAPFGYRVRVLSTAHSVPSVGYGFWAASEKATG